MQDPIITAFYKEMAGVSFDAYGILDSDNKIHTLGTDSKLIGRIFEMFSQPVLEKIAAENGYTLETPTTQTVYPDFIMWKPTKPHEKIAIDIKTTYIDSSHSTIKFTLGSYGSYMRNNTKNIEYKYTDYVKHYVIGFVYRRNGAAQESRVHPYKDRSKIEFPYSDVRFFMQEKYRIAGDKPGSGNTENIGSFSTKSFLDLKEGRGPFSDLGQDAFDIYWKYYPKYRSTERPYTSLDGFLEWLPKNIDSIHLSHDFDAKKLLENVRQFRFNQKR